jgi:hypothetical protein
MLVALPLYLLGFFGRNHPLYDINIIYLTNRIHMALFGFGDIKFDKGSSSARGPLASLVNSDFERTTLRYPLDVGNYDKGHYVVFYIKQQKNTSFTRPTASDTGVFSKNTGGLKEIQSASNLASSYGNELLGKINSGLGQINGATGGALGGITSAISKAAGNVVGSINNVFGQANIKFGGDSAASKELIDNSIKRITGGSLSFLRTTTLTKDAIAMYMPDTLQYTYNQSYDSPAIGEELGGQLLAAGKSAVDAYKTGGGADAAAAVIKAGAGAVTKKVANAALGTTGDLLFTAATGTVSNPMLEMIYKSPNFRTFQFDFTFYPRDEKEALEVQRIIERFRFHQAPELASAQNFLIPPSEFDIKFYYSGAENPNIPQIATCVMTNLDVNYAPNGWSAYEVPGENNPSVGRTGMPTAIQITLQFQEVTYLTKKDFDFNRASTSTLANKR